jgi:endogenous inhibitor of DNA gyrase (YacG/DUF329 family)
MVDIIIIECPFCGKSIKALHKPALVREIKKSSWGGSKKSYKTDAEVFEVTEDCPNCGKTKKEIEKALKHGKEPSNEEIIKRMKEAGLPLKIKG